jgi:RanBP1 domain
MEIKHAIKTSNMLLQVLKVCCNHLVTSDIVLKHISGNDKTWSWFANDFADEKMRPENLGVRFKTVEEADAFKDIIEKVKATLPKCKSGIMSPICR